MRPYTLEAMGKILHLDLHKVAAIWAVRPEHGSIHREGAYEIPIILDSGAPVNFRMGYYGTAEHHRDKVLIAIERVHTNLVQYWKMG